jgi:hypothetical protein
MRPNSPSARWSAGVLTGLLALAALLGLAPAAPAADALTLSATPLVADLLMEIVSDRARLIQLSVIAVAFGIALLWWKK